MVKTYSACTGECSVLNIRFSFDVGRSMFDVRCSYKYNLWTMNIVQINACHSSMADSFVSPAATLQSPPVRPRIPSICIARTERLSSPLPPVHQV